MRVRHILKDGTMIENIEGHIVKMTDCKSAYALIEKINNRKEKNYV